MSHPFDHIVTIPLFIPVCFKFAFACISSAHINKENKVTFFCCLQRKFRLRIIIILAVRRSKDDRRIPAFGGRPVKGCTEANSIAHWNSDLLFDDVEGLFRQSENNGAKQQKRENGDGFFHVIHYSSL